MQRGWGTKESKKMIRTGIALLSLLAAGPLLEAAHTAKYVALVHGGTRAGGQTVTTGDDGVTTVEFIFKDNGRGPELTETYRLAADGTYETYAVKGTSTFGAPVDESFSLVNGKAAWKSLSDAGEMAVTGRALYSPLSGTPATLDVALAAVAAGGGEVALLPTGTQRVRKVADQTIDGPAGRRTVQLMAMTGTGFTPTFVWATADRTPRLFAFIAPGLIQLIEDGWQQSADALEERQKAAENEALVDVGRRLTHRLEGATLIRNARVFDSEKAALGPPSDVLLKGGRIASVTASGGTEAADRTLDAGGRVLLPGLFDMHVHVGRWDGLLHLGAGVTSVRDMGSNNETLQQLMAQEQDGSLLMSHIVPAGFLEGESPMASRSGFVVSDLEGARKAVDWYVEHHYPQLKIYNSFPKEALRETVAYAHAKGLRVSGHVPAFLRAQDAVEAGYDEIQHINQLLLNFFVTPATDTRTLERFYLVGEKAGALDLDSKPVRDFIALLKAKQVAIDPTLATFDFLRQRDGQLSQAFAAVADHMPPDVSRGFRVGSMKIPDDATAARYEKAYQKCIEFMGRMYKAGIPVVAGTDGLPGFTLQRELELYVMAGLTPAQALQVATWNGARYAGVLDDRGSVSAGKRADLVLVDGDPTRNIADIRRIAVVFKDGNAYYPAELHAEIGVKPFAAPLKMTAAAGRQ
jgi:imidazolonepropionase-like amidohydrolase